MAKYLQHFEPMGNAIQTLVCEAEVELSCFISSARMSVRIMRTIFRFSSDIVFSRGGKEGDARSMLGIVVMEADAMDLDFGQANPNGPDGWEIFPRAGPRCRTLRIKARGPDAPEAVAALIKLFPADGGPGFCAFPGCRNPAFLVGPNEQDGFAYRCADATARHEWEVSSKGPSVDR